MKVGELIEQLKIESKGDMDMEVSVGKDDIYFVQQIEAYYDGCLKRLIQDHTNRYYNILGMKITDKGVHLCIHTTDLSTVILDNPDAIIELDVRDCVRKRYEDIIAKEREESKEIHKEAKKWAKIYI